MCTFDMPKNTTDWPFDKQPILGPQVRGVNTGPQSFREAVDMRPPTVSPVSNSGGGVKSVGNNAKPLGKR